MICWIGLSFIELIENSEWLLRVLGLKLIRCFISAPQGPILGTLIHVCLRLQALVR